MNCKRARLHIALRAGDDLDHSGAVQLDDHLAECKSCQAHVQEVESSLGPLQERGGPIDCEIKDSLWPDLLEKLPPRPGYRVPEFNGWWVAMAVSAACAAVLLFWQNETRPRPNVAVAANQPIMGSAPPSIANHGGSNRLRLELADGRIGLIKPLFGVDAGIYTANRKKKRATFLLTSADRESQLTKSPKDWQGPLSLLWPQVEGTDIDQPLSPQADLRRFPARRQFR